MPRRSKSARLYLRQRRQRTAVWVILDSGREISTGAGESDISAAEEALADHTGRKYLAEFGEGHPSQVLSPGVKTNGQIGTTVKCSHGV